LIKGLPFRNRNTAPHSVARPHTAVELTPEGALAATLSSAGAAPVYAFAPLPAGALVPGIAEPNIKSPEAVAEALRATLDQVEPRTRSVSLIIPDTSARVFVLDFDSLPAKLAEAIPVLRFRLRKMVPFDVEHAAVSHQVLAHNGSAATTGTLKTLVTVVPGPILAEYEAAIRAAEYEPGAVLPSSLVALAAVSSADPVLAANLSSIALTISITAGDDLLLYRTIELPADNAARLEEVQRSIAVAAAWFEDKLQSPPQRLHYAGAVPASEFARAIADANLDVIEIAPAPSTGATTTIGPIGFAGVAGALAGVA
jgi:type IV pilus assembly protein PilM